MEKVCKKCSVDELSAMREELVYIRRKTNKLFKFIDNKEFFEERIKDPKQRRLAIRQLNIMIDYSICLTKRIRYFEENEKSKDNKQER